MLKSLAVHAGGGELEGHRADAAQTNNGHNRPEACGSPPERGIIRAPTPGDVSTKEEPPSTESHHNEMTPVYRLPAEILCLIFEDAVMNIYNHPHTPPPFTIASVSRRWRETALSAPALWTLLDRKLKSPAHIDLSLVRSGMAPLHVASYGMGDHLMDYMLHAILPHTSRIQSLKLSPARFAILFHSPAPLLKQLRCIAFDDPVWDKSIFAECTPRLEDIDFLGVYVPLTSPIYADLVNLALDRIRFESPISDLLWVLEACPTLERLALRDLDFLDEDDSKQISCFLAKPIALPMLTFISMSRDLDDLLFPCAPTILASIVIPSTASLYLAQNYYDTSVDLDFIASHAQHNLKNIGEIRVLNVDVSYGALELRAHAKKQGPLLLSFKREHLQTEYQMFLQPAAQRFSLQLEMLEICFPMLDKDFHMRATFDATDSVNYHISLLSSLPNLKKLAFRVHHPCYLLLDALIATPSSYICPQLAKLHLYDSVHFVSWKRVLAVVKSRTNPELGRVNLRKITIPSSARPKDIEGLRAYVQVKVSPGGGDDDAAADAF
ncbi:hypothetical protein BOTBODRAFT_352278 [Botryobasidium botryosum FD-172 SS1]|uniref:Uncharacterized protein n=1 Tax=Botryobasidium botryosum (strain FD-172 SS1) TaxID=930990 RepID=A0A067MQI8_BOTB1|nr:hypothetical protein BOTBODRAFT_352278 [Botryobasidium botryosum FD-172 SS1]